MKAAAYRLFRIHPFGDEHRLRIFFIQKRADLSPESHISLAVLVVFYKRACHIDSEPVTAHIKPEAYYFHKLGKRRPRTLVVRALLPGLVGLVKPVIERGLVREKVDGAHAVSLRNTEDAVHSGLNPDAVRPDVAIRIFVSLRLH